MDVSGTGPPRAAAPLVRSSVFATTARRSSEAEPSSSIGATRSALCVTTTTGWAARTTICAATCTLPPASPGEEERARVGHLLFSFSPFFLLSLTTCYPPLPHSRTLLSTPRAAQGLRLRGLPVLGAARLRNHVCRRRWSRVCPRTTLLPEAGSARLSQLPHRSFRGCKGPSFCQLLQRLHREVW